MERLNYTEAVERFGKDCIEKALSSNAEPTSRMMYPAFENPSHIGKNEYAGEPVEADGYKVTAYYYLTEEEEDDMDSFDWEGSAEFEIEEIW